MWRTYRPTRKMEKKIKNTENEWAVFLPTSRRRNLRGMRQRRHRISQEDRDQRSTTMGPYSYKRNRDKKLLPETLNRATKKQRSPSHRARCRNARHWRLKHTILNYHVVSPFFSFVFFSLSRLLSFDFLILCFYFPFFLVADTQLYKRLCPSVCPSVSPSVRLSVVI